MDTGRVDTAPNDTAPNDTAPSDTAPMLLVGFSMAWLHALRLRLPDARMVFVEEPDVIRKRSLADVGCELVPWEYQLDGAADRFFHRHRGLRPDAVIPVVEYAVPFAARLAERYGVPGAGYGAARLLRDKRLLRLVTGAAGIANPASVEVRSAAEVRAFMAGAGNAPIILKPANRQASVGTVIVTDPADIDAAWLECLDQDEGMFFPDRPVPLRMLAERFVRGSEFSVEMMLDAGRPVFGAVTRKFLFDGPRPVERGHLHPADVDQGLTGTLLDRTRTVTEAVGLHTGFVHCEWIVEDGVPHLVECAGRLAGGGIMDLIEMAWGYGVFGQYLALLRGQAPAAPPASPPRHAAVWYAHAPAGEVESLEGVDEARAGSGVRVCLVSVEPGERTSALRSSWDRVVLVKAVGDTGAEALANARGAVDRIRITVRPVG